MLLTLFPSLTTSFHSNRTRGPDLQYLSPELFFFTVLGTKSLLNTFLKFICRVISDHAECLTSVIPCGPYDEVLTPSGLTSRHSFLQFVFLPGDLTVSLIMTCHCYLPLCFCTSYSLAARKSSLHSPICSATACSMLCTQDLWSSTKLALTPHWPSMLRELLYTSQGALASKCVSEHIVRSKE